MEFSYSREQQMVKKMLKEFAENEIEPISAEIDEKAEYPYETVAKLGELGVMGMPFPQEYGGAGTDYLTYIMAVEEISKVDASHGVIVQTHNALCCWPIFTYGTEEQKRKYLPDLLFLKLPQVRKASGGVRTDGAERGNRRCRNTDEGDRRRRSLGAERLQDFYFRRRNRRRLRHFCDDRQEQGNPRNQRVYC